MNFTPFGTTFTGTLPAGHQFTTAKFAAHQVGTTGGQVLGLLSADEAGVTYLRPVDANGAFTVNLAPQQGAGNNAQHNQVSITAFSILSYKMIGQSFNIYTFNQLWYNQSCVLLRMRHAI